MMRLAIVFCLALASYCPLFSMHFTIVESQSFNSGHDMDSEWQAVLATTPHTYSLVNQTVLDNNAFFASTDVLIISSGVITIPINRRTIIQQFLQSGGHIFLQCEYLPTYETNITFAQIINTTGGSFTWAAGTTSGTLAPMGILGSIATTPNIVPTIGYFWYGNAGTGNATITPFLQYNGLHYGFIYCPPNNSFGKMINTSDQDWVKATTSTSLMLNIINEFSNPVICTNVLPATLTHFDAKLRGNQVKLSWRSSQETNTDFFTVERSSDRLLFTEVAKQKAAGTSSQDLYYDDTDYQPLAGESWYRLKTTDLNGNVNFTEAVKISYQPEWKFAYCWPNPLPQSSSLQIQTHHDRASLVRLRLYDLSGRVCHSDQFECEKGYQHHSLQLPELSKGIYHLYLSDGLQSKTIKLVIR